MAIRSNVTDLMKINISKPLIGTDDTVDPALLKLPAVARLSPTPFLAPRDIVAKENHGPDSDEPIEVLLNGYHFMDPTTDVIKAGTTETWEWINLTVDAHPMHTHLVSFQVVNRQQFDVEAYTADWQRYLDKKRRPSLKPDINGRSPSTGRRYLIGSAIPPGPEEMGFKDTVKSPPGYVTRIRATFTLPSTAILDYDWKTGSFGDWVYHCHILEHEENDMMRPFRVIW